ncbi:LTXXQ domain protein [Pseudomonas sp. NW5]|uniref:LTXXQ domain protein n=1 Tax=Pseudomonas sp. NW5 TaxID=2934934 RepID=UPI00202250B4|nr:LTXXQ domain protein [Pseudomonas sp. NW5]MCL7462056.1 LTXXQ domain protein [Pseudomonas sp. NW5]
MRKTLTALLIAAALPTLAFAGPGKGAGHPEDCPMGGKGYHQGHHGHYGHAAGHSLHGLDLTHEQRQTLREAQRTQMKEHHAIVQRYLNKLSAADQAAMEKDLQANRDAQQKTLRDTLTDEQRQRYDELQKQREARRAERAEFEAWKAERAQKAQ